MDVRPKSQQFLKAGITTDTFQLRVTAATAAVIGVNVPDSWKSNKPKSPPMKTELSQVQFNEILPSDIALPQIGERQSLPLAHQDPQRAFKDERIKAWVSSTNGVIQASAPSPSSQRSILSIQSSKTGSPRTIAHRAAGFPEEVIQEDENTKEQVIPAGRNSAAIEALPSSSIDGRSRQIKHLTSAFKMKKELFERLNKSNMNRREEIEAHSSSCDTVIKILKDDLERSSQQKQTGLSNTQGSLLELKELRVGDDHRTIKRRH